MPRLVHRAGLIGNQNYSSYMSALAPLIWHKYNEPAGSLSALNYGTQGAACDGAYTDCTLAQAGKLSATSAILLNGTTSKVQVPNVAAVANAATWTIAELLNQSGYGEGSGGAYFFWGNGANQPAARNDTAPTIFSQVTNTAPSTFYTVTTSRPGLSAWYWIFITFDNAGDRKVHFYLGNGGAVSELSYSTFQAMTGTYRPPTEPLVIGNSQGQSATLAALLDEFALLDKILTPAQMGDLVRLTGV